MGRLHRTPFVGTRESSMSASYDTLDDIDRRKVVTLTDLYDVVFGHALLHPGLCGVLTTGTLDQTATLSAHWGGAPMTFGDHPEVWHVRVAPKDRMGKPLRPGEVRKVSVLVRQSATHRVSRITNIKLWLLPSTEKLDIATRDLFDTGMHMGHRDRGALTYGAIGVAMHGINVFETRCTKDTAFPTSVGCQTALSAIATISRIDGSVCKMEASTTPHYIIATALAGLTMSDVPCTRTCEETYRDQEWDALCAHNALAFQRVLEQSTYASSEDTALKLMFTAEDIFEHMSGIGYLDMRADPFFKGSLCDDMYKPSSMALILAISVRIACQPVKWGLPPTRLDDAFATKEASLFIESIMPNVLALSGDGMAAGGELTYSIDMVTRLAHLQTEELIAKLRSGQYAARGNLTHQRVERSMKETMRFLMCMGITVCHDLFGQLPRRKDGSSGMYTRYGFASQLLDPMIESRRQSAHAIGLGNIVERWPTLRTSTRGRRQLALADVLVEVDAWLCTGKYAGMVFSPTTQAPISLSPEELDPTAEVAKAPAPAPATQRSAKKKVKKKVDTLLAERSKARDANQKNHASAAVRAHLKPGSRNEQHLEACSAKLNGNAVSNAKGIFSEVLQMGGCDGPSVLFDFTSYVIAPTSHVQCAHCQNLTHVVPSIAFSGTLGTCIGCGHPRCLQCVVAQMRTGIVLDNCLFCVSNQ